jgi:hypothetical protein
MGVIRAGFAHELETRKIGLASESGVDQCLSYSRVVSLGKKLRDVVRRSIDTTIDLVIARHRSTPRDYFLAAAELHRRARAEPTTTSQRDLTPFELRVSSQHGEDGVVVEILNRIGWPSAPFFVEFGIEAGAEGNCVFLADVMGWPGLFIEADEQLHKRLAAKYKWNSGVTTFRELVTPENIEALFSRAKVPQTPDVLSIDIDGADFWVWQALDCFRPRVVVIEYNSSIPADAKLVQKRDLQGGWSGTDYFGASIEALCALGATKGYRLVHTDIAGVNAFFVRDDLPGDWLDVAQVPKRGPNLLLSAVGHRKDRRDRSYADVTGMLSGSGR